LGLMAVCEKASSGDLPVFRARVALYTSLM
jgi:hypothetical protein